MVKMFLVRSFCPKLVLLQKRGYQEKGEILGEFLGAIREGEQKTMSEFADQLGVSRSHLNDIEKNKKSVSPQKAAEYAKSLGYSELQFVRLALQDLLTRNSLGYHVEITKRKKGA